jgi:large subunit ribosomal protein L6
MSRIGKKPVAVPAGVAAVVKDGRVAVKGPRGALEFALPAGIRASVDAGQIRIERSEETREQRALHGLARALVNNMVRGVTQGYEKRLSIVGVGYTGKVEAGNLVLTVGFCQPVVLRIPEGLQVEIPPKTTLVIIRGTDRQKVGQFAATVRKVRPPEPYKGKGIRYETEVVKRKAGKTVVSTGTGGK